MLRHRDPAAIGKRYHELRRVTDRVNMEERRKLRNLKPQTRYVPIVEEKFREMRIFSNNSFQNRNLSSREI